MCGILAMHNFRFNGFFQAELENFDRMLVLTTFRGRDSTGLSGIDLDDNLPSSLVKTLGTPDKLNDVHFMDFFWERAFNYYTSILGHCRSATKGRVSAENAHPFKHGHITLVHNGTISNFDALKTEYKLPDIQVDSDLIAKLFSLYEPKDIIPKLMGAYALVWFDENKKTMNYCRNSMRPLWFARTRDKNLVLLASEKATLEWNASRHIVFYDELKEIDTHTIYTITNRSPDITEEKIVFPVTKYYQGEPQENKHYGGHHSNGYWDDFGIWQPWDNPRPSERRQSDSSDDLYKGQELEFEAIDYTYERFPKGNGETMLSTRIELYNPNYTKYSFFGVLAGHKKEEEFTANGMILKGKINRFISKWRAGIETVVVSIVDLEVVKRDEPSKDGEKDYIIPTYTGSVKLSETRVKHLLAGRCEWCDKPHGEVKDLSVVVNSYFIEEQESSHSEDRLVCQSCITENEKCDVKH